MQRSDHSFFFFFFFFFFFYAVLSQPKVAPWALARWRSKTSLPLLLPTAGVLLERYGGTAPNKNNAYQLVTAVLREREQTEKHCITPTLTFPISFPTLRQPCHVPGSPVRQTPQGIISESPTSAGYQCGRPQQVLSLHR